MNKFYLVVGLIGILIRLILMPTTAHPDLWALFFSGQIFTGGVFNIYDYLARLPADADLVKNYGTNFFTYPPLAYFIIGFFSFLFSPLVGGEFFHWVTANYPHIYQNFQTSLALFSVKFPFLVADLITAFLLVRMFEKEKEKKLAFVLWMFNPIAWYTSFMVGQFDILAVLAVVTALYFASKKKASLSLVALGFGGALKMFPLLFIPFFVFSQGKTWKEKTKLTLLGIAPYFLTILPFLNSPDFRSISLFSNQSQKMLFMSFPVSGAEGIFAFVIFFFFLVLISAYFPAKLSIWQYCMLTLLIFFSVTHYHPQWMLWLAPFLVIELVTSKFKFILVWLIIFLSWFGITILFEPSLNYGLFVPLNSNLLNAPDLGIFVSKFYDVFQLKSLMRTAFAASSLFLIYVAFQKNQTASK